MLLIALVIGMIAMVSGGESYAAQRLGPFARAA
jgi:hypothetical protein